MASTRATHLLDQREDQATLDEVYSGVSPSSASASIAAGVGAHYRASDRKAEIALCVVAKAPRISVP